MKESQFQTKIVKWLRSKGAFVWKCHQNATTRAGVADLFFCFGQIHGFIEVKKSEDESFRPGQKEFLEKMGRYTYAKCIYPENWEEEKNALTKILDKAQRDIEMIDKNGMCKVDGCRKPARTKKNRLCPAHEWQIREHGKIKHVKLRTYTNRKFHPLYRTWKNIVARCNDKNNKHYGGRGIKVCSRWTEKNKGFYNFVDDMGENPGDGYSVDRIDYDGDYTPENCRWANRHTQAINQARSKKDGMTCIYPYHIKNGEERFKVCVRSGDNIFRRSFSNIDDAKSYRDEAVNKLWGVKI